MKKRYIPLIALSMLGGFLAVSSLTQVTHQYRILASSELNEIHIGDKVDIEPRTLVYNGESKAIKGLLIDPQGNSFSGKSFTATESGMYKVIYETYFGTHQERQVVEYLAVRQVKDLFSYSNSVTASFGDYRYNTSKKQIKGAIFEVKTGASIEYKNPIPVSSLNSETPLIDFIVDPNLVGDADFSSITFRVTDYYDSNNYVDILCVDSGVIDCAGQAMYVRAGAVGQIMAGREIFNGEYIWHTSSYGCSGYSSFRAWPTNEPTHSLKLFLDNTSKEVSLFPVYGNINRGELINDLDSKDMYPSNFWGGFTSGFVKLSMSFSNFSSNTGRLVVSSIAGNTFETNDLKDTKAPEIAIDFGNESPLDLPKAKVGSEYTVFDASISDDYDQDLKPEISVTYRDTVNKVDIDVNVKNNKFKTSKEGTYTIHYNASDRSGNKAVEKKVRVYSHLASEFEDISIRFPSNRIISDIYETITVPNIKDAVVTGGSGHISTTYKVLDPSNNEVAVDKDTFVPTEVGTYKICYEATDYIEQVGREVIEVVINPLDKPKFLSYLSLPEVLVKGFKYALPDVDAVITNSNGEVSHKNADIYINGTKIENNTFKATTDKVEIKYALTDSKGTTEVVNTLDAINGELGANQDKYFYGNFDVTENIDDVTVSTAEDASFTFANKLASNEFSVYFKQIPTEKHYEFIEIKMIDALDNRKTVTSTIRNGQIILNNGTTSEFSVRNNEYRFIYTNHNRSINDIAGLYVGAVRVFDNGEPFDGFYNGVYFTLSLKGVSGKSSLAFTKINNQSFGYKDSFERVADTAKPVIVFNQEFINEQEMGGQFFYPTVSIYDVLSDIYESSVKVVLSDVGTKLNTDKIGQETFKIEDYGNYIVTYSATDTADNTFKTSKTVYVYDEIAPELEVGKLAKDTYKVGASVALPTYKANDNSGKVMVDVILVLPDNQMRLLTHEEDGVIDYVLIDHLIYASSFIVDENHFRTEQLGQHVIRVVAYDEQYNKTVVERPFMVK